MKFIIGNKYNLYFYTAMESPLVIYYFSGTGNAKSVARWFSETATQRSLPNEIIDIAKTDRKNIRPPEPGSLIGFISPTHGFNYPPVMMYFIFRFPRASRIQYPESSIQNPESRIPHPPPRLFLMNTRAGMKISKWFAPGLSGIALWLSAIVLILKGYRIVGLRSVDLPSNWISAHPGLKEQVVASIYARCKRITTRFAQQILGGRKVYTAFRDIIQDMLIAPISIGYYFVGRFIFAKSFYATDQCDKCDLCINNCPMKAILKVDNRPFWSYRCESCMRCMNECPKRAIETSHGYIIGIMFLINMGIIVWFWQLAGKFVTLPADNGWFAFLSTITGWLISFAVMVISYRLYHYLLRVPGFRQLFYYTSITRYRFWRRYKPSRKMITNLP